MRASPTIALVTLLALGTLSGGRVSAQATIPRVDMDEALRHVVKKVDPTVPAAAIAAGIGGVVVTEAMIRLDGTVESVRVLGGPAELHQAAIAAIKQWTFQPFVQNGKAARVMAILDVKFPDPRKEEEQRLARQQAEELIRASKPPSAPAPRRAAATLRRIGSVSCICGDASLISDGQALAMAKAIPANVRPWFIDAADASSAMVYVVPKGTGSGYRVGSVGLITDGRSRGTSPGQYWYGPTNMSWIQLNSEALPSSRDDAHWPILIAWPIESGPFTEALTVDLVRTAVADATPRGVNRISHAGSFDVIVELNDRASVLPPRVMYRREGAHWILIRRE